MVRYKFLIYLALLLPTTSFAHPQTDLYANQPKQYGVYLADLKKKSIRFVGGVYSWALSPDGNWIAGTLEMEKETDLYLFPVSTPGKKFLRRYRIEGPASSPSIRWSKDSQLIEITYDPNTIDDEDILLTDIVPIEPTKGISSEHREKLTNSKDSIECQDKCDKAIALKGKLKDYWISDIAYSPNREKIAIIAGRGQYGEKGYSAGIFICKSDGTLIEQVTQFVFVLQADPRKYNWQTDGEDREIIWLPDGSGIVFRRTSHEDEGI